uniref:WRKY19-like zinc finger domain-containing protein n=1 Tax=Salix viminalis TaxID=40686 RepID=A0A6N2KN58_SALVM
MNLHKNGLRFSNDNELPKNDCFSDTALSLNCLGYGGSSSTISEGAQNNLKVDFSNGSDDSCKLVLGLGPTPSAYFDDCYRLGVNKKKGLDSAATFPKGLLSESDSILKLGLSGGNKEALSGLDYSISETDTNTPVLNQIYDGDDVRSLIPVVDEGSTSAKKSGGYMASLLLAPRMDVRKAPSQNELLNFGTRSNHQFQLSHELSANTDFSMGIISEQAISTTSSDHRTSNSKKCKFLGCSKGARGASGLCIGHGGGQRCQKPGCDKGAESRTAYCKVHGGGRRCQHLGCTKSAEGKTDFCIAHGGGRRCGFPGGCTKAARGKSGLCIRHGGGKRCKVGGCTRSAEGRLGCVFLMGVDAVVNTKGASKVPGTAKLMVGGNDAYLQDAPKELRGARRYARDTVGGSAACLMVPKSVHGGTNFCVAHGGGKRCVVPGCTKSARGRTDCCVRHGGGKRCRVQNCGKSAQGSTDFCKAHGGDRDSSMALYLLPSTAGSSIDNNHSYSGVSAVSDCSDSLEKPAKRLHLIPPQVLVPQSMKASSSFTSFMNADKLEDGTNGYGASSGGIKNLNYLVPEGRVHGGGLMSLFGGNLKTAIDGV